MDFVFDPFDNTRLVVGKASIYCMGCVMQQGMTSFVIAVHSIACDDAKIKVWRIPSGGLTETLTEPEFLLIGL